MKVSKDFLRDFAYIANLYGWDAADIEDAKAQTRASPEPMRSYWTALAAAHRAGYEQTEANGYERLSVWVGRSNKSVVVDDRLNRSAAQSGIRYHSAREGAA